MDEAPFYGRKEELDRLGALLKKKSSSLVIIKGRRRIGKRRFWPTSSLNILNSSGKDLDFCRLNLWKWGDFFKGLPEFIYIRVDKTSVEEWIQKLQDTFPWCSDHHR